MSPRPRARPFVMVSLALTLAGCVTITVGPGAGPVRPWPASASCASPATAAADARVLLTLINAERARSGLGALSASPAATLVAQSYACEIAARRDIGHTGSDGSTLTERLARGGITPQLAAENTAEGYATPEQAMAGWMGSPGHRANILRAGVNRIGIGQAGGDHPTWVLDFYAE